MRTAWKLAGPIALAATLLLTACAGDDGGSRGRRGGGSGGTSSGGSGGDSGGDSGSSASGGTSGGSGGSSAVGSLSGSWATGLEGTDSVLTFYGSNASFSESIAGGMDSAYCVGTVSGEAMTLSCDAGDEEDWGAAALSLSGDTLTVAWSNGTSQTYEQLDESDLPEGFLG